VRRTAIIGNSFFFEVWKSNGKTVIVSLDLEVAPVSLESILALHA
jgi:hypothetical protein